MMKFLVLSLVLALAFWLFFGRSRKTGRDDPPTKGAGKGSSSKSKSPQPMLVCAHCGVHLPTTEAVTNPSDPRDVAYCSDAHRLAGPRRP